MGLHTAAPGTWRTVLASTLGLGLVGATLVSCGGSSGQSAAEKLAQWCPLATSIRDSGSTLALGRSASPAELKQRLDALNGTIDKARDGAPDEIAKDANTVNDFYQQIVAAVASHDYQILAAATDPKVLGAINSPDFTAALGRVNQFVDSKCAVTTGATTRATTQASTVTTIGPP
jgi:predicted lipid-binding transport protein (Tim44 family)